MAIDAVTKQRLATLERQVKALMKFVDMPEASPIDGLSDDTMTAIRAGDPKQAIMLIRRDKTCSLDQAKEIYESAF